MDRVYRCRRGTRTSNAVFLVKRESNPLPLPCETAAESSLNQRFPGELRIICDWATIAKHALDFILQQDFGNACTTFWEPVDLDNHN